MKWSFKGIMKIMEWIAMPIGGAALALSLFGYDCKCLTWIAGVFSVIYIAYLIHLLWCSPKFDWHLIHGHFLRKVIAFVLLVPSLIASGFLLYNEGCNLYDKVAYSPKNLVFEENLYTPDTLGKEKTRLLRDSAYVKSHDPELVNGSTAVIKNKLSDRGISRQKSPSISWTVYYHFIDPGNQHMTTSQSGRGWSALIAILGVFLLNGILVSSIIGWVDRRKEKWLKGEVKYPCFLCKKKHYVIIGGNDMVAGIVKQLLPSKIYILIQTSRDVESFRRELFSTLTGEEQQRIIIYYGNRISKEDIRHLGLCQAEEVYILGEDTRADDIESYHDTMNMECLKLISNNIQETDRFNKDNKLTCRVMFEYQTSFNILQVTDIDGEKIRFLPFNYYEMWAQNVLICQELHDINKCKYLPLEGFEGIGPGEDKFVHLVIVGMSRMGVAMGIEAAHLAHYPNYVEKKIRTKITFIDKNAIEEKEFFMGRFKELFSLSHWRYGEVGGTEIRWTDEQCFIPAKYNYLGGDFIDIEWEFLNGSIENSNIQQYVADIAANDKAKLTIAICLPENSRAIAAATYLPDIVYSRVNTLQIWVYQRLNDDLVKQINFNKRYNNKLKAFGMNRDCYNTDLVELSEDMSNAVGTAYNQFSLDKLKLRFNGKGLTDEDYKNLFKKVLSDNPDEKALIMAKCKQWVKENITTDDYSEFKDKLDIYIAQLKEELKKKENHTEPIMSDPKTQVVGKSQSAKMWSNQYNIYSMWTKFRCFGVDPTQQQDFEETMMSTLGKMEHNRWVVEQLLLRYRPLGSDEQTKAQITDLYSSAEQKGKYKSMYAHLDICSNDVLNNIDYNMNMLDQKLIKVLPQAYRTYLSKKSNV